MTTAPLPARRVLAATPDATTGEALAELLADTGYATTTSTDFATAADQIRSLRPHVLLADFAFPAGGARRLLGLHRTIAPEARAALLTNHHDLDAARIAEDLGAHAYLNRPLDLTHALEVVARLAAVAVVPGA